MKQNICVIGCGWLGFPLAKNLIKKGYHVRGSTRSSKKIATLQSHHIETYMVDITSEGITGDIQECLEGSDTLVLNIPPGKRKNASVNYVKKMNFLIPYIEASSVNNVLFVSSTSVYQDFESFPNITESNPTTLKTTNQIIDVETLFQKNSNFKSTILRFSGLFGEDRHPAKYLSGKHQVKNPKAPVNLIHLNDCIAIIERILNQNIWGEIFNAATTPHPSKKKYYTSVCKSLNLPLPLFDEAEPSKGKIIDASKLARLLDYEFKIKL